MRVRSQGGPALFQIILVFGLVFGLSLFFLYPIASAAEWSLEPSLSFREEVNDNFLMTSGPHRTVWGSTLSPAVRFGGETERSEVKGSAQLNVNRYFGEEGLDTTDRFFNLFSRFQWTERTALGAAAGYTEDSTLQSELTETGVILNRSQRRLRTLAPTWKRELTERATLDAGYRWSDVEYDDGSGLFDYRTDTWTANLAYRRSERDQVSAAVSYGGYRVPSASFRSGDVGVRLGATHLFSETSKGGVSGGVHRIVSSRVSQGTGGETDREWGWLIDANLEKGWETVTLRGEISRDIQPSGAGALIQVDRFSISVEKRWSSVTALSLGGDAYRSRPFRKDLPRSDSHYYRVHAGWRRQWTEDWSLEAAFSHAADREEQGSRETVANAASLKISYHGMKWSLSR